jgi:hypothetical protein
MLMFNEDLYFGENHNMSHSPGYNMEEKTMTTIRLPSFKLKLYRTCNNGKLNGLVHLADSCVQSQWRTFNSEGQIYPGPCF